jgi:hypothetical protein
MSSIQCPQCDLVNFADATACKRCKAELRKQGDPRSTACPKCRSGDTQSFPMAYKTGTSTGRVQMGTYSDGGGFGMAGGTVTNQSILAKAMRPPANGASTREGIMLVLCIIFALGVAAVGMVFSQSLIGGTSPIVGIAAALFLAVCTAFGLGGLLYKVEGPKIASLKRQFELATHKWSHSWICLRCGKSWVIN